MQPAAAPSGGLSGLVGALFYFTIAVVKIATHWQLIPIALVLNLSYVQRAAEV